MQYESFFSVSSAAADRKLATQADIAELMDATTLSDVSDLDALILQASDLISLACGVPSAGVSIPTLRSETLIETFRRNKYRQTTLWPYRDYEFACSLFVSRYPVASITSIVEDGTTLTTDDYELRASEGRIVRLSNDAETPWSGNKVVVTYVAGYSTVPEALKLAAISLVKVKAAEMNGDALLRSESFEGLGSATYFQPASTAGGGLPPDISDMLTAFKYTRV
jgi:hypothetical protein